jgi:hypothetical protein
MPRAKSFRRTLDARPDTIDFRDLMYVPTLVEVQERIPLDAYLKVRVPVLDQGTEGACTGFGLATVVHYLLRTRDVEPDTTEVSPRMLYDMARRYDEWPGEDYEGSSARGALKGWHKHGVCTAKTWPYSPGRREGGGLTAPRVAEAARRPLGAYFRVNHRDLVAMHAAITEVKVLYATANVHAGWDRVGRDGKIPYSAKVLGGHAFAIVAYDEEGFWIQNSWGRGWGRRGFARISYGDWLDNGTDVWVARLAVPIVLQPAAGLPAGPGKGMAEAGVPDGEVRPHIVSLGNDGRLKPSGRYGTSEADVREILEGDLRQTTASWKRRRVVLYAHGGLVGEQDAIARVAQYRAALLQAQVYPLAFIWRSDLWTTLTNILRDAVRSRRPEGALEAAQDFLLDRLDDGLEPIARNVGGKNLWDEMKENAILATASPEGGARLTVELLGNLADALKLEIHIVSHSAGSIFHAPIVQLLTTPRGQRIERGPMRGQEGLGRTIASCTLWAPACTIELFRQTYLPAIESGAIQHFALVTLTDAAERDDHCARIYNKSLLYLVAHAFEAHPRIPFVNPGGTPLLGLERHVLEDARLKQLLGARRAASRAAWVRAPNAEPQGTAAGSRASRHGDFDDDPATVQATLAIIRGEAAASKARFSFPRGVQSRREMRRSLGA